MTSFFLSNLTAWRFAFQYVWSEPGIAATKAKHKNLHGLA